MTIEACETGPAGTVAASYRALFQVKGFPQLAAGTVLARTAGQLWQIALVLFVLQRFHSPALAGIATFLAIVPGLVVSPIAGALLDRHGRLRLILLDYAITIRSATACAPAPSLTPTTPPNSPNSKPWANSPRSPGSTACK